VTVPDYLIEKCMDYAERLVAHYTAGDDREANLPWTSADLSTEEFKQWVASRKEAGRVINIETCELGRWHAHDCDPYGIGERLGELSEEECQIGTNRFVRSPESRGWIHEGDLHLASGQAMYDRIKREAAARER
jgi:hypothetical protein